MGPLGHLGIPLPVAHLLKLNLAVTGLCALLPDLVDKPLYLMSVTSCSRYAAHTIMFVLLVAVAFSLEGRLLGLSALFGGMLHLVLDSGTFVPWFYPFVRYDFPESDVGVSEYLHRLLTVHFWSSELIWAASACLAVLILLRLIPWLRRRRQTATCHISRANDGTEKK
jgi:hypothetical protein